MWQYSQTTGALTDANGAVRATGYSGHGDGLNNPALQGVPDVGPCPQGLYSIGAPVNSMTHGPFVLPLIPHDGNEMFGRSGFLIHGDEVNHIGERLASRGCIILPPDARHLVWDSGDHILKVTP